MRNNNNNKKKKNHELHYTYIKWTFCIFYIFNFFNKMNKLVYGIENIIIYIVNNIIKVDFETGSNCSSLVLYVHKHLLQKII